MLHTSTNYRLFPVKSSSLAKAAFVVLFAGYIRVASAQNYDYTGGVALRYPNETCPYNDDYIGTSYWPNCCPSWTKGAPSGSGYCCPTNQDCYVTVADAPKCADPSWVYCYDPKSQAKIGFCCLEGWTCYVAYDGSDSLGVACQPPGLALNSPSESSASTSLTAYQIPGSTSTSTATTTSSQATTTSATRATASATSPPLTEASTGLSTGAKAGIGVGAAVGGLLLLGLVAWASLAFFKRRHARGAPAELGAPPFGQSQQEYGYAKVAPHGAEMGSPHYNPGELDGAGYRSELEGSHAAQEMGVNPKWR